MHPSMRHTTYRLDDTSPNAMFRYGFERAIVCSRGGCSVEDLRSTATAGTAKDQGVMAACEVLLGWYDLAEGKCREFGMTRREASTFVAQKIVEAGLKP